MIFDLTEVCWIKKKYSENLCKIILETNNRKAWYRWPEVLLKICDLILWFCEELGAASTEILYCFTQTKGLEFNLDWGSCPETR